MKTTDVIIVADVSGSMQHLQTKQQDAIYALICQLALEEKAAEPHVYMVAIQPFGSRVTNGATFRPASAYKRTDDNIQTLYCKEGSTRLLDAIGTALNTSKPRRAEATLIQVFTDGGENASTIYSTGRLAAELKSEMAKDRLTVAVTGPQQAGSLLKSLGLPDDNFRAWDGRTVESYGQTVQATTSALSTYTESRSKGVTRSTSFYSVDPSKLNAAGVRSHAKKVTPSEVKTVSSRMDGRAIADFFTRFEKGRHYYQLVKGEYIEEDKDLVVHIKDKDEFRQGSRSVRLLLGLPESGRIRVKPAGTASNFDVYVQSASVNRKLVEGQKLLTL
jgi:hypothetical protein